jgi:hypothetical protein
VIRSAEEILKDPSNSINNFRANGGFYRGGGANCYSGGGGGSDVGVDRKIRYRLITRSAVVDSQN